MSQAISSAKSTFKSTGSENLTDFSEDVAPVSDVSLTQKAFGVVLMSPASFYLFFFPQSPWFYIAEVNCKKLVNLRPFRHSWKKKEIKQMGILERWWGEDGGEEGGESVCDLNAA